MKLPVSEIFEFVRNGLSVRQKLDSGGLPITRIETIADATINLKRVGYAGISSADAKQYLLQDGDILFSHINSLSHLGKCTIYNKELGPLVHGMNLICFRVKSEKLLPKFALYLIRSNHFKSQLAKSIKKSVNQASVSTSDIKKIILNFPPLAEQKRIAAVLDTADRILKQRESAIAKLDQLAQSVFVEMFGSSQNFENKKLSEVCDLITDGTHYTPTYVDNGVVFLSAKNVTKGTIDWNRVKYVPESLHKELQKRVSPKKGDILLAKNGTTGVAAIVDRDVVFDIYVSLALLRPKDLVDKTFLHAALNSTLTKRQFNSALKGIGVPNLHLVEIRKVTIPVPSVNEQKKFVEILDKINNLRTYFLKSELLIKNKISSLQHQSFAVN
jgi:type I restriction enzyme S subunit